MLATLRLLNCHTNQCWMMPVMRLTESIHAPPQTIFRDTRYTYHSGASTLMMDMWSTVENPRTQSGTLVRGAPTLLEQMHVPRSMGVERVANVPGIRGSMVAGAMAFGWHARSKVGEFHGFVIGKHGKNRRVRDASRIRRKLMPSTSVQIATEVALSRRPKMVAL